MSHDMFMPDEPDRPTIQNWIPVGNNFEGNTSRDTSWDETETDHIYAMFERPDWFDHGACRAAGPQIFYPGKGESTKEAKQICRSCPVRKPCLEYALDIGEHHGIWGGFSERERRRMRGLRNRRKGKPAPAPASAVAVCGTDSGYHKHRLLKEETCAACRAAHNAYEARRVAMTPRRTRTRSNWANWRSQKGDVA